MKTSKQYVLCPIDVPGFFSYDPATDEYITITNRKDLKIWDIQNSNNENFWFDSASRPSISFTITELL